MERVGAAEGLRLGADEEMPAELVPAPPDMSERYFPIGGKRNDPGRKYMMARMGIVDKTMKDVARFNKFDGVVLAFNCVWDGAHPSLCLLLALAVLRLTPLSLVRGLSLPLWHRPVAGAFGSA
eukprot:SAG11_NODE_538_length_8664_cov_5.830590_2_plen_123_part_00